MSTQPDDGGPVYPAADASRDNSSRLRDEFAKTAMRGDWSSQGMDVGSFFPEMDDGKIMARAKLYYRMADAMLAARGK